MHLSPRKYLKPHNSQKADEIRARLEEFINGDKTYASILETHSDLVAFVAGHSPFLAKLISRDPVYTLKILSEDADDLLATELQQLQLRPEGESQEQLMQQLRRSKARVSLLTAVMDISNTWTLDDVTKALSDFAEASLSIAAAHALHKQMKCGELAWPKGIEENVSTSLAENTGFVILGLGKLGAYELNYSSDIDLIVLYDNMTVQYTGQKSPQDCFVKVTRDIVELMDKRTMDGYVFRTDLRLRPDPGATPIALSMSAAESYYHSLAQNWERSAMIKARPVAGDIVAGQKYLDRMTSWIWRRSMDYEALRDIQSIKNQILRHYNQTSTTLENYDVKLGQGGIREVEFYAQVNQLVFGGRDVSLRSPRTLDALDAIVDAELIEPSVRDDLKAAYILLRDTEHRLQMINDEQTHTIPESTDQLDQLASFMGHETVESFQKTLLGHTAIVKVHYDALMVAEKEDKPELSGTKLMERLETLGYEDCEAAFTLIDSWMLGRYRSLRTSRARELLGLCLDGLLSAFAKSDNPMGALRRFDRFIEALPAGVQVFSLFQSNPRLFKLIATILTIAPALADQLAKRPTLWEAVLDPQFFEPLPSIKQLKSQLRKAFRAAQDYQDILDIARRFVAEHRFQVGVHVLDGLSEVTEAGFAMTRLADATLQELIPHVEAEFANNYGRFPGGGLCVLAMGKYGGKELTYTSDLDVVLLYDVDDFKSVSNGRKPLQPSQYFSRLGQSFITAVTALTSEGLMFDLDTRLRPSGSAGPLVVTLKTFREYYQDSTRAWTWEHMALTRARIIFSPSGLKTPLLKTIHEALSNRRDQQHLLEKVAEMREKLDAEFSTKNPWSAKFIRGGLVDMEFIAQYLMLKHGAENNKLFSPYLDDTYEMLDEAGYLPKGCLEAVRHAHKLQQTTQSILRLCLGSSSISSEDEFSSALKESLVSATKYESFSALKKAILTCQKDVFHYYNEIIQNPYLSIRK